MALNDGMVVNDEMDVEGSNCGLIKQCPSNYMEKISTTKKNPSRESVFKTTLVQVTSQKCYRLSQLAHSLKYSGVCYNKHNWF